MAEILGEQHDPLLPQPLRQSSARKPPVRPAAGRSALGCDGSEQPELISIDFKVIETQRPKPACCSCDPIVKAVMHSETIERSCTGPVRAAGAHSHDEVRGAHASLPSVRYVQPSGRGAEPGHAGAVSELPEPLYDLLRRYVLKPGKVHTDDIPVAVQ